MKKLITLCICLLSVITFTAMAQSDSPKAEFKFDKETHDFGKIPQGKPVEATFEFTNTGDEPLVISEVKPTCGCTIADFTKTPVLKGKTGTIKLTFNAAVANAFSKAVTVMSNSKTPVKMLYIKGEVVTSSK